MVIITHVSHDFNNMNVAQKLAFAPSVPLLMATNAVTFVTPKVPLANLTTATTDLNAKNQSYILNPNAHSALINSEKNWLKLFREQADYVDSIALGDAAIIALSGFHSTQSESHPTQIPVTPHGVDGAGATHGHGGAHLNVAAQKNATFLYFLSTANAQIIQTGNQFTITIGTETVSLIAASQSTADFEGLPSHIGMNAQVAAVNRAGASELSSQIEVNIP